MPHQLLATRGTLSEPNRVRTGSSMLTPQYVNVAEIEIPLSIIRLIHEDSVRQYRAIPIDFDGETIKFAVTDPDDLALADTLRFLTAKNVKFVASSDRQINAAIDRHYGMSGGESVDSMLCEFTETAIDFTEADVPCSESTPPPMQPARSHHVHRRPHRGGDDRRKGRDTTTQLGRQGMLYYTVEEGQRVLMCRRNGTMDVIIGPQRVWRGLNSFRAMRHHVAHPGEYLVVRYRDGRQRHIIGPADVWFDEREHLDVTCRDVMQVAAKEAVVVYSKPDEPEEVSRRIVYGPAVFVPEPGEWLHTFSWHASDGGSRGVQKVPNALVFQKLWLMPDQMYHDVNDVRTADDAVLTIKLMVFFELVDIERMLETTHDPIGDFVNAATSDVVDFTGRHDFESFKRNTDQLNELETYKQLTIRAAQGGYRIDKVVYRGYGAAESLQQMHDQAIEARTRLQLDKETERQSQELENYKLDCQLARSSKRREEQADEVEHDIRMQDKRQSAELAHREAKLNSAREQSRLEEEMRLAIRRQQDTEQLAHLTSLGGLGVDLTSYLTQSRADRVIELRGQGGGAHLHLDEAGKPADGNGRK